MPEQSAQRRETINEALQLAFGFHQKRVLDEAEKLYLGILEIEPACFDALHLLGILRQQQGRDAEGLSLVERALELAPRSMRALGNRGTILARMGRHREALEALEQVVVHDPTNVEVQSNLAMLRLTLGNFREGWPAYEWRFKKREWGDQLRDFAAPQWRGDAPLDGKTILLYAEQGYGDAIQFVRYAPMIAQQGARVVVEVDKALQGLLSRIEGIAAVIARGDALPVFNLHSSLLSLPLAFRTEIDTIPSPGPYLAACPERVETWRERLPARGRRIGLVWAGKPTHSNDRNRSIAMKDIEPLLGVPGTTIVVLQRDINATDRMWLEQRGAVLLGDEFSDYDDTAAVVSLLDLIITVDTSVAHLAGAMGKPVWILLPTAVDWRWMLEREDSPWYPTARLWRQAKAGNWPQVIARVRSELASPTPA